MAQNENLVFGVNPVLEKIHASSADILEILISDDSDRAVLRRIGQEATRLGLRVVTVQRKVLDRLVEGQRHQGVVAKVDAYGYLPFEVLLQEISATTAGAAYHVSITKVTNLRRAISQVKERGYWVVGLDSDSPDTIYERSYPTRLAIVLGSEGKGMRPLILHECDFLVSIPMLGKVESLNVGAAAAVFFYELLRQSRNLKPRNG